ncbi:MAG: urea carboxylase-associated protein 1 [Pseudoalteromonas tetraodonis]|jgi:urea carboxylase-associated protein 1
MIAVTESTLDPASATYSETVLAGDHWMQKIPAGATLRILDIEGNQAADTLFYNAADPADRYCPAATIRRSRNVYLRAGTGLYSLDGTLLLTITADTCGRHDTVGGACSRESNTMRYDHDKEPMHACRDSFLAGVEGWGEGMGKADVGPNINFFMNVPVTPDGKLTFEDGISAPGRYVEMRAETDVICLISNCPQLNNPCNAYNPTPVGVLIWE